MKKNASRVYSTDVGRICPSCQLPAAACRCGSKAAGETPPVQADGIVRVRREAKGRKGKTVTLISGLPLVETELREFASILKQRCGSGGTVQGGVIVIQGDHRETLIQELRRKNYVVKIVGG